jgi:murein L,D-transpeptidase YafK
MYHRALLIDYPNNEDWETYLQARKEGRVPDSTPIGGLIEIHGRGGRQKDWTNGCVAVTDGTMDILAGLAVPGTPVTIVGARRPQELPRVAANGETEEKPGEKR